MKLYSKSENFKLYQGNMLDMLEVIEKESIDSIITDPPYGLTSITKRFGKENSAPAQYGKDGAFSRLSKGFMGKEWDGSGIEYNIETWQKCYDVLKPGGYLLAFGGTRTYHRIACAIEDAGFEIRDCIMWLYGSGFPKSMDISKQIDKRNKNIKEEYIKFGNYLRKRREENKISKLELGKKLFSYNSNREDVPIQSYEIGKELPTKEIYQILKNELDLDNTFDWLIEREEAEREIIGKGKSGLTKGNILTFSGDVEFDITKPATELAKKWEGWRNNS